MSGKRILEAICIATLLFAGASQAFADRLPACKWAPATHARLEKLIEDYGKDNPNYNAQATPYAVFDWDETCSFGPTSQLVAFYIVDTLDVTWSPAQFSAIIRKDIPAGKPFNKPNDAGKPVSITEVAADLEADYAFLHANYIGQKKMSPEAVKATDEYKDFAAKFMWLLAPEFGTFETNVPLYVMAGMTPREAEAFAVKAIDHGMANVTGKITLTSPASRAGKTGVVSGTYSRGARIFGEMASLINVLQANGIDVYIISGGNYHMIKSFATLPKYGYNVKPDHVFGTALQAGSDGRYTLDLVDKKKFPRTWKQGKTITIKKFIAPAHGNRGPVMVAGDAAIDSFMLTDFDDTSVSMLVNRLPGSGDIAKVALHGAEQLGRPDARFILQGRDENLGQFRPSEKSIPAGKTEALLLNPALQP